MKGFYRKEVISQRKESCTVCFYQKKKISNPLGTEAKLLIQVSHEYGLFWHKSIVRFVEPESFLQGRARRYNKASPLAMRVTIKNNMLTQELKFIPNNRPLLEELR